MFKTRFSIGLLVVLIVVLGLISVLLIACSGVEVNEEGISAETSEQDEPEIRGLPGYEIELAGEAPGGLTILRTVDRQTDVICTIVDDGIRDSSPSIDCVYIPGIGGN